MVDSFADVIRALNAMKETGPLREYAIAGAMALVFWTEPIATFDVDVLVWLSKPKGSITTLDDLYDWAKTHAYPIEAEHIFVSGVPVQFLPSHNALADEAIATAVALDYEGESVRVVRPEYLIALYLEPSAKTSKRRERAAALVESPDIDQDLLEKVLARYNLAW